MGEGRLQWQWPRNTFFSLLLFYFIRGRLFILMSLAILLIKRDLQDMVVHVGFEMLITTCSEYPPAGLPAFCLRSGPYCWLDRC